MKERIKHLNATVCYLKVNNEVLMIKYKKKWGQVYSPPGGKFEMGESPLDCIIREFKEETNLELVNPRLQGYSYWQDEFEGIIFIFVADEYKGELKRECDEGILEWIKIDDLDKLNQFDQNKKFTSYLFKEGLFEGKFKLDNNCHVIDYEIRSI